MCVSEQQFLLLKRWRSRNATRQSSALRRRRGAGSEGQFQPLVGGDEAKPMVEAVRIWTRFVTGQLDQGAATPPGFADRPGEHGATQAAATVGVVDVNCLDLGPQRATAGQSGCARPRTTTRAVT